MKKNIMSLGVAWTYEIMAAVAGLVVAAALTIPYYNSVAVDGFNSVSAEDWSLIAVMALPFLMASMAELFKIPFVQAFMTTKQKMWKLFFGSMVFVVSVITFETMYTGLSSGFSARNFIVEDVQTQIKEKEGKIESIITGMGKDTKEELISQYESHLSSLEKEKNEILVLINTETAPLKARLETLEDNKLIDQKGLDAKIINAQRSVDSAQDNLSNARTAFTTCKTESELFVTCLDTDVKRAEKTYNDAQSKLNSIPTVSTKFDSDISSVKQKIAKIEADNAKHPKIAAITAKISKLTTNHNETLNGLTTTGVKGVADKAELESDIAKLNTELDKAGRNNVAYRLSNAIDITLDMATLVLAASLAFIISVLGPALATGYFIANGQWVGWFNKDKPKKTKRKSKFRALARSIILKKRKPTIKEVEVEKEVIKEVKVEVEKEVIKEVIVEKTIVKHVPVYTNDPDLLELTKQYISTDTEVK